MFTGDGRVGLELDRQSRGGREGAGDAKSDRGGSGEDIRRGRVQAESAEAVWGRKGKEKEVHGDLRRRSRVLARGRSDSGIRLVLPVVLYICTFFVDAGVHRVMALVHVESTFLLPVKYRHVEDQM